MERPDAEMSAVTLILYAAFAEKMPESLVALQAAGLRVTRVDNNNGVVEGDVAAARLADLKKCPAVESLRVRFNWIAEYPSQDPGRLDADQDPEEPDDAP